MKLRNLTQALQAIVLVIAIPIGATAISIPNSNDIYNSEKTETIDGIKYTKIENGRHDNAYCMKKQLEEIKATLRDFEARKTLEEVGVKGVQVKLTSTLDTSTDDVRDPVAGITKDKHLYIHIKPVIRDGGGYTGFCHQFESYQLISYLKKVQEFLNKSSSANSNSSSTSTAPQSEPE